MERPGIQSPVFLLERIASISVGDIRKLDIPSFSRVVDTFDGLTADFEKARFEEAPGYETVSKATATLLGAGLTIHAINVLAKCAWAANRHAGTAEGARYLEEASRIALEEENLHLAQDLMDQAMMMGEGSGLPDLEKISGEIHMASGNFDEAASVFSHLSERISREGLESSICTTLPLARAYVGIASNTDDERRRDFFLSRAEEFLDQCKTRGSSDEKLCAASIRASVRLSRDQNELAEAILESVDSCGCSLQTTLEHCRMRAALAVGTGDRNALLEWCRKGLETVERMGFGLHVTAPFREIEKLLYLGQSLEPASEARALFFTHEGMGLLSSAVDISDSRDEYIADTHSRRVTKLAMDTAARVLSDGQLDQSLMRERLEVGAMLHDIGKLFIPWRIVNSIEPISTDEKNVFRRHPLKGAEMCRAVGIDSAARMVAEHHEECDGSGYPEGTDQISPPGRILSTVNSYINSVSDCRRTRTRASTPSEALEEMKSEAGRRYDPAVLSGLEAALD